MSETPVLTKSGLVDSIAELNDITKAQAQRNLEGVVEVIVDACKEGCNVNIAGFGQFIIKNTEERQGRNPATGASITIPAGKRITFKPAKAFKDAVGC